MEHLQCVTGGCCDAQPTMAHPKGSPRQDALHRASADAELATYGMDSFAIRSKPPPLSPRTRFSISVSTRGRPRIFPCCTARRSPALTRSRIISRSNRSQRQAIRLT